MKYIFLILLFISITLAVTQTDYKCGDSLKLNTCSLSQSSSDGKTTNYVKACSKGKYCESDLASSYNVCIKRRSLLEIGDKCVTGSECSTDTCSNEKCVGASEGSDCKYDSNCDKGLCCSNKKCTKYVDEGAACSGDSNCKAGYVYANSVCTLQFSIETGSASSHPLACKSNFEYEGKCAEVVSVSQCVAGETCTVTMTTSAASDTSVTKTDCSDDDYTEDCKYYQWRLDRLSEWKNYLDEYNKKVDDFKGDEDL